MPTTISQPHPNLYIAHSDVFETNSGIFCSESSACLVDPAVVPEDIQAIQRLLKTQNLKPEHLVITHYHYDHVFGPDHFPGVPVIAHAASQNAMTGEDLDRMLDNVRRFEQQYHVRRSGVFRPPQADITFEYDLFVQVGGLQVQLLHSPGHSPDQCVLYQSEAGILWAADMLSDLEIPFVYHSLAAYQETLECLSLLAVRLLVPGHGAVTADEKEIRKRFHEDMAYLAELRQRLEDALQAGRSLEEAQADCENMRFKHPEDNAAPHRLNVEIVYSQMLAVE